MTCNSCRFLVRPFLRQWPLILTFIILLAWDTLFKNPVPYRLPILIFQAWLLAGVVEITRSRIVKVLAYLLIFSIFIYEQTLSWCYGMHIAPTTLLIVAETTPTESAEFLHSLIYRPAAWWLLLTIIGIIVVIVFLERLCRKTQQNSVKPKVRKWLTATAGIVLLWGLLAHACYSDILKAEEIDQLSYWLEHQRNPRDASSRLFIAFQGLRVAGEEVEKAFEKVKNIKPVTAPMDDDSLTVVLVIGESYIKSHAQAYGYPHATTPFLMAEQQVGRAFLFTDCVSPYCFTSQTIRSLLNTNSIGDGERWSDFPPLMGIFKKAGWSVSMHDNQKTFGQAEIFTFSLNGYLYNDDMAQACYNETNEQSFAYDGQLIDYFVQQSHPKLDSASHRLVIFHLMGQHTEYRERYPSDDKRYEVFTADSIDRHEPWMTRQKRQMIAEYDNATLYNDCVMQQITQLVDSQNAVLIYVPDHGEEVYDYRDSYGRDHNGEQVQMVRHQFEIPFVVWCSDMYQQRHPETIARLRESLSRPMMIDNTCQMLFRLAGLHTPYYISRRDVLSPDYHCPPRLLLDGAMNYDEVMGK